MNSYLKVNSNLSIAFLFIILFFAPIYKYCENVLFFPRINITILYTLIFLGIVLYNTYHIENCGNSSKQTNNLNQTLR